MKKVIFEQIESDVINIDDIESFIWIGAVLGNFQNSKVVTRLISNSPRWYFQRLNSQSVVACWSHISKNTKRETVLSFKDTFSEAEFFVTNDVKEFYKWVADNL